MKPVSEFFVESESENEIHSSRRYHSVRHRSVSVLYEQGNSLSVCAEIQVDVLEVLREGTLLQQKQKQSVSVPVEPVEDRGTAWLSELRGTSTICV